MELRRSSQPPWNGVRPKFHDRHHVENEHEQGERHRDRNVARPPAARLFRREDDAAFAMLVFFARHDHKANIEAPRSTIKAPNNTNR